MGVLTNGTILAEVRRLVSSSDRLGTRYMVQARRCMPLTRFLFASKYYASYFVFISIGEASPYT